MGRGAGASGGAGGRLGLLPVLLSLFCPALPEQVRYTIPEEMPKGSVVGNLAKDLGFSERELPARKLRVSSEKPYFTVSRDSGELLVGSRLDREQICGKKPACALEFEAVAEDPLNFYHVSVEIEDINDHTPKFTHLSFELQISESAQPGTRFILEVAEDTDIASNSLQIYKLSLSPNFSLVNKEKQDGSKYPELVLEKPLDREQQSYHRLVLTALDGGNPPLSGTTELRIQVTDANDNPPVFSQEVYRASLSENVPPGTTVLQVSATDQDEGINSEITYSFYRTGQVFALNSKSGEIITQKTLDFEEIKEYSLVVEGRDGGGLVAQSTVEINVQDENDNSPEITFHSLLEMILENAAPGTLIALIKIHDQDSGENGEVNCRLEGEVPFKIISSSKNSYKLVTDGTLDRELTPEYNITITATDKGKPPLSSSTSVTLYIADVNDNTPVFQQVSYLVCVAENNPPGASIAQVSASDPDLGPNGHVSYAIVASDLEPRMLASYVSVNAQSGVVLAQRAFDHEQRRAFQLTLQARDQGSPALGANVSLRVLVGDRNDNAPRVLHPALGPDGAALFDTVPRAAEPGYLVTKVVAVDADAGHNAWLSYHVLQASDPGLFSLGLRTGEVRTARALGDRDAARHRLLVAVQDGGQPPLSATATLHLVFADSLQEALPDLTERPVASDPQAELQFYLVVALALISVLFLLAVIVAIALRLRQSTSPTALGCFHRGLCTKPGPVVPPNYSEGTLPYSFNMCVAQAGMTEISFQECNDPLSSGQDILCGDSSGGLFPLCNSSEPTSLPETLTPICNYTKPLTFHKPEDRLQKTPPIPAVFRGRRSPHFVGGKEGPNESACADSIPRRLRGRATMAAATKRQRCEKLVLLCALLGTLREARANQIRYSTPEEREKGYVVGNISGDLGLEPRELGERGVRIVSRGRTQLFSLNPRSGSLVTAGRIDREELCAQSAPCLVTFKVLIEDRVKLYGIEIEVTDINDNAPQFEAENLEVKISEIAAPGERYPLPEAADPDVGVNSLQSYQLSPSHHFSLDVQTADDGAITPELVLERTLDREEEATHHLVLTASDGGDPRRSSTVHIQVTVLDTNDNAPVFAQPIYRVKVLENVPPGTLLVTVRASDLDEGANGKVVYKLRKVNERQSPLFQLNENTGEISVSKSLDYEECSSYEMEIQAEDGGGLKGRTKVLISVEDVNDNRPEVTITSLFSPVREDAPEGTVIALFHAHDQDSGKNGQVVCSIQENMSFKLENSIEDYYRLLTAQVLDREKTAEYNITVLVTDQGIPPLSTEIRITLDVADINDNAPAFSQASYSIYLPENNPRGTSIFSVTALDPDNNENARIFYSLAEDTIQGAPLSSYVSINSDTGMLYALRSFDYEQFQNLHMQVRASDSGNPPLSSNVSLNLFILDQNDNTPEILYPTHPTDGSTGVELAPRSAEPGYLVTKVVAMDRDSGQNAWLSYRLLKASEPGLFMVGLHTGEIRTSRALLERDALKQSLVVAVQDHGQPPLSATVTLTVAVADSIPDVLADLGSIQTMADPDDSNLTLYLVVAVAIVSCVFLAFVLVLLALRLQHWHTSRLLQAKSGRLAGMPTSQFVGVEGVQAFLQTYSQEFSLTADSRKSQLIFPQPNYADTLISQESSNLTHKRKRSPSARLHHGFPVPKRLFLVCGKCSSPAVECTFSNCEGRDPARTERAMGDSCAHRRHAGPGRGQVLFPLLLPLFYPALCEPIRYSIPEESAQGSVVGNLARDLGLGVQDVSARKLRVSAEKLHFSVDAQSGDLLVKDRIDREQTCKARRRCELPLEAVVENPLNIFHIIVVIEDINDHAPQFDKKEIRLEIFESVSPGARISLDPATDPDINSNSIKDYQISPNPYFSLMVRVNSEGGKYPELSLEKPLDREEQKSHRLILTALDGGEPPRSATAQIEIFVKDTNDNRPVFSKDEYRVSLSENLPPGSPVLQVTATDEDEGVNAEIQYSFRSTAQSTRQMFSLDEKTGVITNNQSLDFEDADRYTMEVEAKDGGGLSTQCKVIIEVLDENDNSPEIIITSLSEHVLEDSTPGTVVALFKTRDRDLGRNGEVTCDIGKDLPFKIHSSSNNYYKLVTDGALDREQVPEYNISITATDRGEPPLSSSTYLILRIADVNDNAPVFQQDSYTVHVAENNPPGASIAQVSASDPDLGPNGHVSYAIVASDLEPRMLASYVSVNAQSGVVLAQRAFDHEQRRAFQLTLQARDQGSPALGANVSLRVLVGDRNDNAPRVLHPALGPDGAALFDTVPRAAEPGYLVTKVVAVDADAGHNAWLSYHVLQASDPGLFSLGLRTGEVRTARALGDRDAARHRLLVAVRDGGQPPLSATATLHLVFADSLQEALPDLSDHPAPSDPQAELQFYLVVALALISVLFLLAVTLAIALRLRHFSSTTPPGCLQSCFCSKSEPRVPHVYEGTLPYSYNLCIAQTGKAELDFLKCSAPLPPTEAKVCANSPGTLISLHSGDDFHPETAMAGATAPTKRLLDCKEAPFGM
ncbi:uncharacterized protein ACOB6Z_006394 [Ctenodactylus gundi]